VSKNTPPVTASPAVFLRISATLPSQPLASEPTDYPKASRARRIFRALVFAGTILLGVACQFSRWPDVFVEGEIFFLDPDCYSRMTRVAAIEESGLRSIRRHGFENAPDGVVPHTTMPLDALVAVLSGMSGRRDLAGAVVSPLLGLVFLAVVAVALWNQRHGWAGLLLAAVSPELAHGFSVGRPDHQSLAVLLVTAALVSGPGSASGGGGKLAAGLWGLACWVTLFEPPIVLAAVFGGRVLAHGRRALPAGRAWWQAPAVFCGVLGAGLLVDGWRGALPGPEVRELFPGWASTIGELRPAPPGLLAAWLGWAGLAAPAILLAGALIRRDRALLVWVPPLLVLLALALTSARWGYFLAAVSALALPGALGLLRPDWLARSLALVSLWPVAAAWEGQIFPEGEPLARRIETRRENLLLRSVADDLSRREPGVILAPWWISPALAYWTGFPCVAGSSHQSLPGTADSARFFLGLDDPRAILARRGVRYVVADDAARLTSTSLAILQLESPSAPPSFTARLSRGHPPDYLMPLISNPFFPTYGVGELEN